MGRIIFLAVLVVLLLGLVISIEVIISEDKKRVNNEPYNAEIAIIKLIVAKHFNDSPENVTWLKENYPPGTEKKIIEDSEEIIDRFYPPAGNGTVCRNVLEKQREIREQRLNENNYILFIKYCGGAYRMTDACILNNCGIGVFNCGLDEGYYQLTQVCLQQFVKDYQMQYGG